MRMIWTPLVLFLAGCGIDGAPERPAAPPGTEDEPLSPGVVLNAPSSTGVVISGEARMGSVGNF